jgi:hypothetical protein
MVRRSTGSFQVGDLVVPGDAPATIVEVLRADHHCYGRVLVGGIGHRGAVEDETVHQDARIWDDQGRPRAWYLLSGLRPLPVSMYFQRRAEIEKGRSQYLLTAEGQPRDQPETT